MTESDDVYTPVRDKEKKYSLQDNVEKTLLKLCDLIEDNGNTIGFMHQQTKTYCNKSLFVDAISYNIKILHEKNDIICVINIGNIVLTLNSRFIVYPRLINVFASKYDIKVAHKKVFDKISSIVYNTKKHEIE